MKSLVLVVWLAAAATAAVVSNEVPTMVKLPDVDEVADVNENEVPEVIVTDVDELTDAAEEPALTAVANRRNLHLGTIGSSVRIFNQVFRANGVANRVLTRDVQVRATGGRRITAIRVNRIGASQNATPSVVNGGIGNTHITIRIRSARGRGYNYRVEVYAR